MYPMTLPSPNASIIMLQNDLEVTETWKPRGPKSWYHNTFGIKQEMGQMHVLELIFPVRHMSGTFGWSITSKPSALLLRRTKTITKQVIPTRDHYVINGNSTQNFPSPWSSLSSYLCLQNSKHHFKLLNYFVICSLLRIHLCYVSYYTLCFMFGIMLHKVNQC